MTPYTLLETPFQLQLSFYQIIDSLEKLAEGPACGRASDARELLNDLKEYPEFRTGITDVSQIDNNEALIGRIMADYFPPDLTLNEIKGVSIPYVGVIFNKTQRFRNILNAAGEGFEITIRDMGEHAFYVNSCCLILNEFYGTRLDLGKPMFYDIPAADGTIRHYRILYNADFIDILPTEHSLPLSKEDIILLMNNYDDLALWKEKFPPESWILKGFALMTLYDATIENAVSLLKEKLLGLNSAGFRRGIESIFQSIYRIPDLGVGFSLFNPEDGMFSEDVFGQQMKSFMLRGHEPVNSKNVLCSLSFKRLIEDKAYFSVSDTTKFHEDYPESPLAKRFLSENIQSFILAPVVKNNVLLGVLEVVSLRPGDLNSVNAHKLEVVMPFLTESIERLVSDFHNQIQAVIQNNYTTIHTSVYWKFRAEAQRYIEGHMRGKEYGLKEVTFSDVYPLYGQIDIKGSSEARNISVQKDLEKQLKALLALLNTLNDRGGVHVFKEERQQLEYFLTQFDTPIQANTEQYINTYLDRIVHYRLKKILDPECISMIDIYFREVNKEQGSFYIYRRKYETTISTINEKMSQILDKRQSDAQALFPHYYERFKTDGVDHNLYMGASISPGESFNIKKFHELRLWQLRVLCEMESAHHHLKRSLPYPLDVTTLILAYHSTISIRFRMDEKRFDVDGTYNARFEIVKKRIDKAHVKNTDERITEAGKITIVYLNDLEEQEYMQYIKQMQHQYILGEVVEKLEVEDLQGISGLKALRVTIIHSTP